MHSLLAMSLIGGSTCCSRSWDAARALRLIEQERITALYLAPTLFHDLVPAPDAARAVPSWQARPTPARR